MGFSDLKYKCWVHWVVAPLELTFFMYSLTFQSFNLPYVLVQDLCMAQVNVLYLLCVYAVYIHTVQL